MRKLIRDKYGKIINFLRLELSQNEAEYEALLQEKLYEEINELRKSNFSDTKEYTNVLEVLLSIAKTKGISIEDIQNARQKKLNKYGGFKKGLILNF